MPVPILGRRAGMDTVFMMHVACACTVRLPPRPLNIGTNYYLVVNLFPTRVFGHRGHIGHNVDIDKLCDLISSASGFASSHLGPHAQLTRYDSNALRSTPAFPPLAPLPPQSSARTLMNCLAPAPRLR
eukprot:3774006-Prymnesium_polylepis.1